jgi:hypothetical protein
MRQNRRLIPSVFSTSQLLVAASSCHFWLGCFSSFYFGETQIKGGFYNKREMKK